MSCAAQSTKSKKKKQPKSKKKAKLTNEGEAHGVGSTNEGEAHGVGPTNEGEAHGEGSETTHTIAGRIGARKQKSNSTGKGNEPGGENNDTKGSEKRPRT